MPKRRGHSKKGAHKGEKVKSRVAFQGTIDRRKKAFHPKTPATSKPQFQSPDFLSPEKSKAESRNAFFESSSPTNNGVLGIKKNNFKIAAVRKSIVNQHQRLRVGGKLLHTETSPRVGDHQILTNNMDTGSSTCCDEPLGSPIRRMKRAMRYVDKNTCITQRVAIDVGTDTRIIIPCFEGITTVMDLVETVRQRFPEQNIVELQLFNKTLPVEGFVAELIDAEHVLTAISKSTIIDGIKPAGVAVGQMNNIDEIREESEDAKGNSRIVSSDSQSNDSQRVLECSGVDEIRTSTAVNKIVDKLDHDKSIAEGEDEAPEMEDTSALAPELDLSKTTSLDRNNSSSNPENDVHQSPPVSPSIKVSSFKPFTPDRKLLENRRGASNGRLKKNVFIKKKKDSSNTKVASDKAVTARRCIAKETDVEGRETTDAEIKVAATKDISESAKQDQLSTSETSQMSSLVRDRLLDRIVSLASRGAITPSQQKYLNSLINVDDSTKNNDACPEQSNKALVPTPPEDALKPKSSLVVRSLKYHDANDSGNKGAQT